MQNQFQSRPEFNRNRNAGTHQRRVYTTRPHQNYTDNEPQESYQQLMDRLYTLSDRVTPTRSVRQAYEHAAMIYRTTRVGNSPRSLFETGTWTKDDEKITLTLVQFSAMVQQILRGLRNRQFNFTE